MSYIALASALMAVCSWISIPTAVPFTLQTFAVFCILSLLGGKRGTAAILVYLLLGAIGLPVFAEFTSGIGIILGNTGGYMLGFIFTGLIYWAGERLFAKRFTRFKFIWQTAALIVGLAVMYLFGTVWFMAVYAKQSGPVGIAAALSWCVFPFIIPDLIKLAAAILVSRRAAPAIKQTV